MGDPTIIEPRESGISPTAPKIKKNGLSHGQYGVLGAVDKSTRKYGATVSIEACKSVGLEKRTRDKLAHAADARRFFQERVSERPHYSSVVCFDGQFEFDEEHSAVDSFLKISTYSPEILQYMMTHSPRLLNTVPRRGAPFNSDFYGVKKAGISPFQQQIIYCVVREALKNSISPDDIFCGSSDVLKGGGINLPNVPTGNFNRTLDNCCGAFLEMYVAESWMYTLDGDDYGFFSRVHFPLWDTAHINGEPLSGEEKSPGRSSKEITEIDLIFALSPDQYQRGLERIAEMHSE